MDDLISRNAALDYHITISDLPGNTKIDELVGIGVEERLFKRHIKGLPAAEAQPETKVTFYDEDHVWIDGKQYISLRRFHEAVKEAQPKEGHWIEGGIYRDVIECNCSECGQLMTTAATVRMNYCPRCGARMKEGEPNG